MKMMSRYFCLLSALIVHEICVSKLKIQLLIHVQILTISNVGLYLFYNIKFSCYLYIFPINRKIRFLFLPFCDLGKVIASVGFSV